MSVPSLDEMTAENISSMLRDTYTFKGDWLLRNAHALANKLERQAERIAELEKPKCLRTHPGKTCSWCEKWWISGFETPIARGRKGDF